jgi:hypothetical protein
MADGLPDTVLEMLQNKLFFMQFAHVDESIYFESNFSRSSSELPDHEKLRKVNTIYTCTRTYN